MASSSCEITESREYTRDSIAAGERTRCRHVCPDHTRARSSLPSSNASWRCARFRPSARACPCPSGPIRAGMASTSPSSAGTPPASASTSSPIPRMPCRPGASFSMRPGTRPATSGTCGWRGSGPASSTGFASPDRTRRTTGTASIRTSSWWIPTPPRSRRFRATIFTPPSPTIPPRAQKDLSFSEVDDAAAAPKCIVTHEDFDWQGDQPLRHPWTSTVIYELHVRGYTIDPSAGVRFPGTYRGLIEKIPHLKDLGYHRGRADARPGVQRARCVAGRPENGRAPEELLGLRSPRLLRSQGLVRERPPGRRAGPGVQGDGPRLPPRRSRGDSRRGLQPHVRRRRAGADGVLPGHRQRDLLLAGRRQAILPRLHGHGPDGQRGPSGRPRSHPRCAALLGHGDACRRLPLRSRLGARPGSPRPRPRRRPLAGAHCRGPDPPRHQAHRRGLGQRRRLSGGRVLAAPVGGMEWPLPG